MIAARKGTPVRGCWLAAMLAVLTAGGPDGAEDPVPVARGVTINGLAILDEDPELGRYYADHLIGGAGAFVLTVQSARDFAEAVRDKLIREIGGLKLERF